MQVFYLFQSLLARLHRHLQERLVIPSLELEMVKQIHAPLERLWFLGEGEVLRKLVTLIGRRNRRDDRFVRQFLQNQFCQQEP